nr:hypothetical protein Iba_chr08bCG11030 [Ipomoea batatas]
MATRDSLRESNMVMEIEPNCFFTQSVGHHRHPRTGTICWFVVHIDDVDLGEVNGDAEERETPTEAGIGGLMSVPARSSILPTVNLMDLSGCRTLMIDREILIRIAGDGHPMFNFSNGYRQIEELVDQYGAAMFCFLNFEFGKIHILVFDVCGLEVMYDHLWDYTIEDTRFPDARFKNYGPPRWHRWR